MTKEECKAYVDKLRDEYLQNHIRAQERDELISENNIEKRDIKGYHGREILELLQNADDAYQKSIDMGEKPDCDLEVYITFVDNILSVSNTGTFFDAEGIKAIVQGNNSTKNGKYIGNKGTGFRSVLNWASKVRIFSGVFNVEFSERIASDCFEKIKACEQIEKQLNKKPNLYIPMLAVPVNMEQDRFNDRTTIEVELKDNLVEDGFSVSKQLENIDLRILLFLPNISKISIETMDTIITYERQFLEGDLKRVKLTKMSNGESIVKEEFFLFEKLIEKAVKEDEIYKDVKLSIAVPTDFDDFSVSNMYSYFPLLDTPSPFYCVMHASFSLGDHRNTITVNDANCYIMRELLSFVISVSEDLSRRDMHSISNRLVIPIDFNKEKWKFSAPFNRFEGLDEFYLDELSKAHIFTTVNKKDVAIVDSPKAISGYIPESFHGKGFDNLLNLGGDIKLYDFISYLCKKIGDDIDIAEKMLCSMINGVSDAISVEQRVKIFVWWNERYNLFLPRLLKTQEGRWLEHGEVCYFLTGDSDTKNVPSWVKIPSLRKDYQKLLFFHSEKNKIVANRKEKDKETNTQTAISRIISQNNIYPTIEFTYRDANTIISTVNASVDTYTQSVEFVKWLWNNYHEKPDWKVPGRRDKNRIKYRFPSANKVDFVDSELLFFGKAYNNKLAEKLFGKEFSQFPGIEVFDISDADKEEFIFFIKKFGVNFFPKIEVMDVLPNEEYKKSMTEFILKNGDVGVSTSLGKLVFTIPFIRDLETVLPALSVKEVVEWIVKDPELKMILSHSSYLKDAVVTYQGYYQSSDRFLRNNRVKNYILEIFNSSNWIEVEGVKYSPKYILKGYNSRINRQFIDYLPSIKDDEVSKVARSLSIDDGAVTEVLDIFAMADRVTELPSEKFYEFLLNLPQMSTDVSFALAKAIYRIVEQPSFNTKFGASNSRERFLNEGMMLVQYEGKLQFCSAKDVYLPSSRILNKHSVPIVEKGFRTNNDNFVEVFGCKIYTKDYEIQKASIIKSDADDAFQKYFKEFFKYARAYSEYNKNIDQHGKNLKITLVKNISIIENEIMASIDEEYIPLRDKQTNWYITIKGDTFDINTLSEIIENIFNNIANTTDFDAGKIGELFRAKETKDREFLIKKEFGTLNVIEDEYYQNEMKNNFIAVFRQFVPNMSEDDFAINFYEMEEDVEIEKIIKLFRMHSIDIAKFNDAGFVYSINLKDYYSRKITSLIKDEERIFIDWLYTKALSDKSLQSTFVKTVDEFRCYMPDHIPNSVYYDYRNEIEKIFGIWTADSSTVSAIDTYKINYDILNPLNELCDEIMNDSNVKRMIYFKEQDEFKKWCADIKKSKETITVEENPYEGMASVVPTLVNVSFSEKKHTTHMTKKKSHTGAYTTTAGEKRSKAQKIYGNKGELIVYNLLCEKYGKENVHPRSEAYVDLKILAPGQAISGEYDISYTDEDKKEYFVEVKTSEDNSFFISTGELEFARKNAERYRLYLVSNVNQSEPKCQILDNKFWEDDRYSLRNIVEKIEVTF